MMNYEYRAKHYLSELSDPVPKFFKEIMMLYGVDLPIYLVPRWALLHFTDEDAVGYYWIDAETCRPLGILIAKDVLMNGYRNPNLSRLKTLLHEIAHHLFHKEAVEFARKAIEEHKASLGSNDLLNSWAYLIKFGIENRIEKWVRDQWRELRKFINSSYTGWRRGVDFEHVKRSFKYNHYRYLSLFR
jgi:hypothetical protein